MNDYSNHTIPTRQKINKIKHNFFLLDVYLRSILSVLYWWEGWTSTQWIKYSVDVFHDILNNTMLLRKKNEIQKNADDEIA